MTMKKWLLIWLGLALVLVSIMAFAAAPDKEASDAVAIHRFFADCHLIVDGVMGLIQPIGALLLAFNVALTLRALKNQKKATAQRGELKSILHSQNETLAVLTPPNKE